MPQGGGKDGRKVTSLPPLHRLERIYCLLVDSHAHIDTSRFQNDREAIIQAAFEGRVTRIVDPGCDLASSRIALALAKAHPGVVFASASAIRLEARSQPGSTMRVTPPS